MTETGKQGGGADPARIAEIAYRLSDMERKAMLHREDASEACMSWTTADKLYELGLTQRNARFLRLTPLGHAVRAAIQHDTADAHPSPESPND